MSRNDFPDLESWQVIVDFDGTITLKDTTDHILQRFAEPGWEEIEEDWVCGKIGSRECMRRQIALLKATPAMFRSFVEAIAVDAHFKPFVLRCRKLGIPVTVVSDGLDQTIRIVLERIGLGDLPYAANRLMSRGGDRWELTSPHADPSGGCNSGTCKCQIASGLTRPLTLLVGDGRSDFCMAGEADLVFAKNSLVGHCLENGIPHFPFTDFREAVGLLDSLVAGPVANRAALANSRT